MDPKKQSVQKTSKCPICSSLRPLSDHLYEMAMFCTYLDNSNIYSGSDGPREVHTLVIGNWLRLAGQLESVKINAWKYAGEDAFWCGTAADRYDIDTKIFTKYSTALTRFIYICYALEETYRFCSSSYIELARNNHKDLNFKRLRKPSVQSAFLVDQLTTSELPNSFLHIIGNLNFYFVKYIDQYKLDTSGLKGVTKESHSYGLHLVRNLRNHIAHGAFPLMNDFIDPDDTYIISELINLLLHASRSATIYIQALIKRHCQKFKSHEYLAIEGAYGEEFDYFLENCTLKYALTLHLTQPFCLCSWMDSGNKN